MVVDIYTLYMCNLIVHLLSCEEPKYSKMLHGKINLLEEQNQASLIRDQISVYVFSFKLPFHTNMMHKLKV